MGPAQAAPRVHAIASPVAAQKVVAEAPKLVDCSLAEPLTGVPKGVLPPGTNPGWWEDMTGSRHARAFLDAYEKKKGIAFGRAAIGVVDAGGTHSAGVEAILEQASARGTVSKVVAVEGLANSETGKLLNQRLAEKTLIAGLKAMAKEAPKVVNFSIGLSDSDDIHDQLVALGKTTITVASIGNDYPEPPAPNLVRSPFLISVGSVDPYGEHSTFSQIHSVEDKGGKIRYLPDIVAPSDYSLIYRKKDGKLGDFGGTSGSAPVVTAAIADVTAILPGADVTVVRELLRKTATLTNSGQRMLNHYRLVRAALRLREAGGEKGWRKHLDDATKYDFTAEAREVLMAASKALLPIEKERILEAFPPGKLPEKWCPAFLNAVREMHRASLLASGYAPEKVAAAQGEEKKRITAANQTFDTIHEQLAHVYKRDGVLVQADFFNNQVSNENLLASLKQRLTDDKLPVPAKQAAARTAAMLAVSEPKDFGKLIDIGLANVHPDVRQIMVIAGAEYSADSVPFLRDVLTRKQSGLGDAVGYMLRHVEPEKALALLQEGLPGGAKAVADTAVTLNRLEAMARYGAFRSEIDGEEFTAATEALAKVLTSPPKQPGAWELQGAAAQLLGALGPEAEKQLRAAFADPKLAKNAFVRAGIVHGLADHGMKNKDLVVKALVGKDEEEPVVNAAILGLRKVGGAAELPDAIVAAKRFPNAKSLHGNLAHAILTASMLNLAEVRKAGAAPADFLDAYLRGPHSAGMDAASRAIFERQLEALRARPVGLLPRSRELSDT